MAEHNDVVILSGCRTAIGRFGGSLSSISATDLGGAVIAEAVRRAGIDPALVDEALMGNVISAGLGQAPARQAAIKGGLPADNISASTINKVCGSGLKSVMLGTAMIRNGDADAIVAGGMESMNRCPYLLLQARTGYRLGHGELLDSCVSDGLWCSFEHHHMGNSAEWIASEFGLTRQELDSFARDSHRKAVAAIDSGKFEAEIVPYPIPQRKGPPLLFSQDECPGATPTLKHWVGCDPSSEQMGWSQQATLRASPMARPQL
jgi:acetyl-CoA C-acetyltransferase